MVPSAGEEAVGTKWNTGCLFQISGSIFSMVSVVKQGPGHPSLSVAAGADD